LLTQSVTALIGKGLITLAEIAVDGTKIRASASKKPFKTGEKLLKIEATVTKRLTAPKQELTDDPGASSRRRQAARQRAARCSAARRRGASGARTARGGAHGEARQDAAKKKELRLRRLISRRVHALPRRRGSSRLQRPDRRRAEGGRHRRD
jgi:hypothetical protein